MKARMEGERPSLAELIEFCEGDEGAAMWMAQCWGQLHPADACMDTAYALKFYRETVQGYFKERRAEYEAGRKEALFDAIWWAAAMGTPIPEWARAPFSQGWQGYQAVVPDDPDDPSVSTLGGAFGITRPKGFNASAARFWGLHASLVWNLVTQRAEKGESVGPALFRAVAQEISEPGLDLKVYAMCWGLPAEDAPKLMDPRVQNGISAGTVKRIYYEYKAGIEQDKARKEKGRTEPLTRQQKMTAALRGWR